MLVSELLRNGNSKMQRLPFFLKTFNGFCSNDGPKFSLVSHQPLLQTSQGICSELCSKPKLEPPLLWSANPRPIPWLAFYGRRGTCPSTSTTGNNTWRKCCRRECPQRLTAPSLFHSRITLSPDGTLRLANVSKSDAGGYTCFARNRFGMSSTTGRLLVTGKLCNLVSRMCHSIWIKTGGSSRIKQLSINNRQVENINKFYFRASVS